MVETAKTVKWIVGTAIAAKVLTGECGLCAGGLKHDHLWYGELAVAA